MSLLAGGDDEDLSSSLDRAKEEEGRLHPGWGRVRAAYARKVGVKVVYGAPAGQLARLLADHGDQAVLEAIDRAPDELGVRLLAEQLPEYIGGADIDDQEATVTSIEVQARARVAHLEQLVATYRAEDAEPPEDLVAELARCQNGYATPQEARA